MPKNPSQARVLVIDDAPAVLELMRELLEEEHFNVTTRACTPLALDEIKELQPNLVILDTHCLGREAGWSLLQTLRLDHETCAIPIVLCTGAAPDVEALGCHLAVMDVAVILKPFDIDELMGVVKDALCSQVVA